LALKGTGDFLLNSPHNDVATLAADVQGSLSFGDQNDLTVGTVGRVKGIRTRPNGVPFGNSVTLDVLGKLTIGAGDGAAIDARHGAPVLLKAGGGVLEQAESKIEAGSLTLQGAGKFLLGQSRNHVEVLFAMIRGDLDFHELALLQIGS